VIRFNCKNCGQLIKVSDSCAGKKGRCPKCSQIILVPSAAQQQAGLPSIVKFRCPHCSQKIGLPAEYAGRQVRCGKCRQPFRVPVSPSTIPAIPAVAKETSEQRPGLWNQLPDLEELKVAESSAPAVEKSLKFAEPPRQIPPTQLPNTYQDPLMGFSTNQQEPEYKPKNINAGLFIGLGCLGGLIAAVVMFAIFGFGLASNIVQMQTAMVDVPEEAQQLGNDFIGSLKEKDYNLAKSFLSEQLQSSIKQQDLERFGRIVALRSVDKPPRFQTVKVDNTDADGFMLWGVLQSDRDISQVFLAVSQNDSSWQINSAFVMSTGDESAAIGKNDEEFMRSAVANFTKPITSANWGLPCFAVLLVSVISVIQIISLWMIFERAGQPGWAALVPVYNMWVLAEVAGKPGWLGLVAFAVFFIPVPLVGPLAYLVFWIIFAIGMAKTFGRGTGFGIGLSLLPVVFYPILAFEDGD
jgi:hypothetical protein